MESNLKNFKFTILGLGLMAIGVFITEAINIYKILSITLWVNWGVYLISFILISLGLFKLWTVRKEFKFATILSIGSFVLMALSIAIVFKGYLAFGIGAFLDIKAMFLRYLAEVFMLAIIYLSIKGYFQLMARSNVDRDFHKGLSNARKLIVITLISMMFIPFGQAFSSVLKVIICAVFLFLNTSCKFMLLKELSKTYNKMYVVKSK